MRHLFFVLITIIIAGNSSAQDMFMPRDVQQAYNKGTRSMDGNPGKNYWQNYAHYTINITAMPPNRTITGSETISYINNSPDTLKNLSIKLFLNIHKPGAERDGSTQQDYLTTGVHFNKIAVNGKDVDTTNANNAFTNYRLPLTAPLMPHDSVQLCFNWYYDVSVQSGREGMIDSTSFFIAYFYPRVAVYDDYNGWDRMPFVDSHEFYSDFNDYSVSLTVPKNYIVVGTGTLQQPEKILQPDILNRYKQAFSSDATINIVTPQDNAAKKSNCSKYNKYMAIYCHQYS